MVKQPGLDVLLPIEHPRPPSRADLEVTRTGPRQPITLKRSSRDPQIRRSFDGGHQAQAGNWRR